MAILIRIRYLRSLPPRTVLTYSSFGSYPPTSLKTTPFTRFDGIFDETSDFSCARTVRMCINYSLVCKTFRNKGHVLIYISSIRRLERIPGSSLSISANPPCNGSIHSIRLLWKSGILGKKKELI